MPGEIRTEPAAKLTGLPSTDLMTTGRGLNNAEPREAPSISAVFAVSAPVESMVSVTPQAARREAPSIAQQIVDGRIIDTPDGGCLIIGHAPLGMVPVYTTP